jgi:uncharacterized protein (TIGR03000 family)
MAGSAALALGSAEFFRRRESRMASRFRRDPSYRLHQQSGQAIVTLADGFGGRKDFLLGPYGTPASKAENVRAPAGATLWINAVFMGQGDSNRQFISPPLENGRKYIYDVKARWIQDGREMTSTRTLEFPGRPNQSELRSLSRRSASQYPAAGHSAGSKVVSAERVESERATASMISVRSRFFRCAILSARPSSQSSRQ